MATSTFREQMQYRKGTGYRVVTLREFVEFRRHAAGSRRVPATHAAGRVDLLARGLAVFGLAIDGARDVAPPETHRLAVDRQAARARRDYAEADRFRAEIERLGWGVPDVADAFRLIPKGQMGPKAT